MHNVIRMSAATHAQSSPSAAQNTVEDRVAGFGNVDCRERHVTV